MIDDWWLMIDDWWLMIDDWWLIVGDGWSMIDEGSNIAGQQNWKDYQSIRNRKTIVQRIYTPNQRVFRIVAQTHRGAHHRWIRKSPEQPRCVCRDPRRRAEETRLDNLTVLWWTLCWCYEFVTGAVVYYLSISIGPPLGNKIFSVAVLAVELRRLTTESSLKDR